MQPSSWCLCMKLASSYCCLSKTVKLSESVLHTGYVVFFTVPLGHSDAVSTFSIQFRSVAKPLHMNGDWFGYYADYVIQPGQTRILGPSLCNSSQSPCERYCYHGFLNSSLSNNSCITSCLCKETAKVGRYFSLPDFLAYVESFLWAFYI
jgi:hypothetical protein